MYLHLMTVTVISESREAPRLVLGAAEHPTTEIVEKTHTFPCQIEPDEVEELRDHRDRGV